MSKRIPGHWAGSLLDCLKRSFLLIPILLFATHALGQRVKVTFEEELVAYSGSPTELTVSLDQSAIQIPLGGFDFLIGYDASQLSLLNVSPESLLTSCAWEYFTYRVGPFGNCDSCPSGLVRVVGIADINNGDVHPSCYLEGANGPLFSMRFLISPPQTCNFLPVYFYWIDCGDNVFATATGETLFVADSVFSFGGGNPLSPASVLPSANGLPDSCLALSGDNVIRHVNFFNGGIDISCDQPYTGDVNLNGIPFEVADLVLFGDYFLYGVSVFTINLNEQIAQTEINNDGYILTYRDWAFLYRVTQGDTLPPPKAAATDTAVATFIQNSASKSVFVNFNGNLAGAWLEFHGQIVPSVVWGTGVNCSYSNSGPATLLLIWPTTEGDQQSGLVLTYTGEGTLDEVATTDWDDSEILTVIETSNCGDANGSGVVNIADVIYYLQYIFTGGPPPVGGDTGDYNCDGKTNIGDAVFLVRFIFLGGPPPCEGCM